MKTRKERWKELLPYEKKFDIACLVLLCIALIFLVFWGLDKVGVLIPPFDLFLLVEGACALGFACGAVTMWRKERSHAIFYIVMAAVNAIKATYEIAQFFR